MYSRDEVGPESGEGLNHTLPARISRRRWPVHLGDLSLRFQEKNDPRLGHQGGPREGDGANETTLDQTFRIFLGNTCYEENLPTRGCGEVVQIVRFRLMEREIVGRSTVHGSSEVQVKSLR